MMAKVAPNLNLIKDLGNCQDPTRLRFGELVGDAQGSSHKWPHDYITFICYLATSIEVHSTCMKKRDILFLLKRTTLHRLSISNFFTKFAYVLCKLWMTHANEHLEKEVKENWIFNFKLKSQYISTSMFRNAKSEIWFQIMWLKIHLQKPIDA